MSDVADYAETVARALGERLPQLSPELKRELAARVAEGRRAMPDFKVPAEQFAEFIAVRLEKHPAEAAKLQLGDLYLACACLAGSAPAIVLLRRDYLEPLAKALHSFPDRIVEDVLDPLCEKLLVGADAKLAEFGGVARLRRWLKTVAINAARDLVRRRDAPVACAEDVLIRALEEGEMGRALAVEGERELARHVTSDLVRLEIGKALARLEPGERTLLRGLFVERLTLAELGRPEGADPAKMHRRLQRIYRVLRDNVHQALREQLSLSPADCESIVRTMFSRLDIRISQLLGPS